MDGSGLIIQAARLEESFRFLAALTSQGSQESEAEQRASTRQMAVQHSDTA